jgi:hypothetical protein
MVEPVTQARDRRDKSHPSFFGWLQLTAHGDFSNQAYFQDLIFALAS